MYVRVCLKVEGVRFTYGSPLVDSIADCSDPLVKRLEANGGSDVSVCLLWWLS